MDKRGVEIRALCDVDEWFEETFNKPTKEKYGWVESVLIVNQVVGLLKEVKKPIIKH